MIVAIVCVNGSRKIFDHGIPRYAVPVGIDLNVFQVAERRPSRGRPLRRPFWREVSKQMVVAGYSDGCSGDGVQFCGLCDYRVCDLGDTRHAISFERGSVNTGRSMFAEIEF